MQCNVCNVVQRMLFCTALNSLICADVLLRNYWLSYAFLFYWQVSRWISISWFSWLFYSTFSRRGILWNVWRGCFLEAGCPFCYPTKPLKETPQPLDLVLLPAAYWHSDVNNHKLTLHNSSMTYRLCQKCKFVWFIITTNLPSVLWRWL